MKKDTVVISANIPRSLLDRLNECTENNPHLSRSQVITILLHLALESINQEDRNNAEEERP